MYEGIIFAFDFGIKSIGVAIGQRITCTARPLSAFKIRFSWKRIENIIIEWQPNYIIVGLPLNIDGSDTFIAVLARKFAKRLYRSFGINVILHDERLSTVEARISLFSCLGKIKLEKKIVDASSAVIILESFFSSLNI